MKINENISKEEIYYLAQVTELDVEVLMKVRLLLDPMRVRRKFIKYEYQHKKWSKRYKLKDIVLLLMAKYNVSRSYIESVVYNRPTARIRQCVRCSNEMTAYRWKRNDGVCDECLNFDVDSNE